MSVFITAEIGINHNGDLDTAKKLIDMAVDCGCDAVKFQKRTIDIVYTKEFLDSPRESPWGSTQREQKEGLELSFGDYGEIDYYCGLKDFRWFASAWDIESQLFLREYGLPINKVASPMLTNIPFLKTVAEEGKHTFISTGMSTLEDIDKAVAIFDTYGCPYILMHCYSVYPANGEDLNLSCIQTLKETFPWCDVGYSGHEVSPMPSIVAVALGAVAIERHITLDRAMYGSDQSASLESRGLKLMVDNIRNISKYLGDGIKRITPEEQANADKLRYW